MEMSKTDSDPSDVHKDVPTQVAKRFKDEVKKLIKESQSSISFIGFLAVCVTVAVVAVQCWYIHKTHEDIAKMVISMDKLQSEMITKMIELENRMVDTVRDTCSSTIEINLLERIKSSFRCLEEYKNQPRNKPQ